MKKIILIISAMILILSFSRVKAESYTSLTYSTFYKNPSTQYTYDSANGYWYATVTQWPTYMWFNNSNSQSLGMNIPSNSSKIRFSLILRSANSNPDLIKIYNSYSVGVYYDKGGLTYCNVIQATNYNINQAIYTNEIRVVYECPVVKTSTKMSVIYIDGRDGEEGWGYYIGINPNFTLTYDDTAEGIQGVIQEQQDTNDKLDKTNEIMNQTIEYNTNVNTNTKGANETIQAGQMEDQLIQQNEFNGSIMEGMTINSSASGFIWQIMERLRGMNIAIVTLMTMALGLGVIKLVLNR